jgi:uncharacterized protein
MDKNLERFAVNENSKLELLQMRLLQLKSAAVAFSGGVDSTLLLYLAHQQLGDKCIAVTAHSKLFLQREFDEAVAFCKQHNIAQVVIERDELNILGFAANPLDRCYICKHELLLQIKEISDAHGLSFVLEGSNLDDDSDYRPGMQAVKELAVLSPLRDEKLTKHEIRKISLDLGLPTHSKPSFACLATRFPYYEQITLEGLDRVAKAEQWLLDEGIIQVRVRVHGDVARIETDHKSAALFNSPAFRKRVNEALIGFGFAFVALDLMGYRSGSMNSTL